MRKMVIAAFLAASFASVSMAALITVSANTADAGWKSDGTIYSWAGQTNCRVGSITATVRGSLIIPFQLPTLLAGQTISNVMLKVYVESGTLFFPIENINMDILGGRVATNALVKASDWNYGTVVAENVSALTVNASQVSLTPAGAYSFTLNRTFLQDIYNADSNAAGKYVFFTLYPDNVTTSGANRYVTISSADNATAANRPSLEITTADDASIKLIETSANSLGITEGTTNSFQVRLSSLPAADVTVRVSRVSGDTNIQVLPDPSVLVFSATNWNVYQPVYIEALADVDTNNAAATIECADAGGVYTLKTVQAAQIDITPVVMFSAVPTAGFAPLPVTFTDTSSGGITNRFWDFGDGETTNTLLTTVSHTYTAAGNARTVQLTVSGPLGGSTKTQIINVPDSMKALPVYNSFSDNVSTSAIPAGWACFAPDTNVANSAHSRVDSGSLAYSGLQASAGNSWGLGAKIDDYCQDFVSPNLAVGETVYYSFLIRLNSPLDPFNSGYFRLYDRADAIGSGINVGWGTSTTNNFTNTTTMGFAINNRNVGLWSGATVKTPETYTAADTVYLLVGAYTRGSTATNGLVQMWVNPDSATFGTATPPAATLSTNSFASDAVWNRLEYVSNGSGSGIPNWQVDEVRIATSWADVVPAFSSPVADADSDGLPDEWETLYFGSSTGADPGAVCANGVNTVLEAYIAGLNPSDPQSVFRTGGVPPQILAWNSATGRLYSVYWTTNLMNGFQCIASNIPWTQNSLTNPAPAASSFYKVEVRLE